MELKILFTSSLLFTTFLASGQVTTFVEEPEALQGALAFTWAQGWGANPDLNDPLQSVSGTAIWMIDADGTWGCQPPTNAAEVVGKIAVIRRGGPPGMDPCEFGLKALNAQNAGAIAVVIVNNAPGEPIAMGGGASGATVAIPVVMITQSDGDLLEDEIYAGNVVLFIGSLTGQYPFNLGMDRRHVLQPPSTGRPGLIASDASELSVDLGSWIINYGSSTDASARLGCTITQGGATLYDEEASPATIAPGDSVWFALPTFSQGSYAGHYEILYTAITDGVDSFPQNNTIASNLHVGDVLTYASQDPATGIPIATQYVLGADAFDMTTCIFFSDPNANRLAATGMYFSGFAGPPATLDDRLVEVTAYLWTDAIASELTLPSAGGLTPLATGEYFFLPADQGNTVFAPFIEPLALEAGENYLFCMETYDDVVRHGWDSSRDYEQNLVTYGTPVSMLNIGGTWYNGFTNLGGPPSIGVSMVDVNTIGIEENKRVDITPFPNPAVDVLRIPVNGQSGSATLEIFALTGSKIAEQRVSVSASEVLTVNVAGISNGSYMFHLNFENGRYSSFQVVVNR